MKKYFKDNDTILFQGDSVTDCGRKRDAHDGTDESMGTGYPLIFKTLYNSLFPDNNIRFVNRGVSGNRVRDLLTRYDEDFKNIKPDFISIMIGINDTWRAFDSGDETSAQRFKDEYEMLLKRIKNDFPNAQIMIIEQFALTTYSSNQAWIADLDPKRKITKLLSEKYADFFIPMYDIMKDASKSDFNTHELSEDGVHPAQTGHSLIAAEIIKALHII